MDFGAVRTGLNRLEERRRTVSAAVVLTGFVLSFLGFVDSRTFASFAGKFAVGMIVTVSAAYSLTTSKNRKFAVAAFLVSSAFLFFIVVQAGGSCFAWSPHTAQNPVTGECEAFIYGGCGPKPDPWYYQECSPESKQELCNRIPEVVDNNPEQFERMVCATGPDSENRTSGSY